MRAVSSILAAFLTLASVLFCASCRTGGGEVTASITSYGLYSDLFFIDTNAVHGGFPMRTLIGQKQVAETTNVPARLGTAFGFRFQLDGQPRRDEIEFVIIPPKDSMSADYPSTGFSFKRTIQETIVNPFIGYLIETNDLHSSGAWLMQIKSDNRVLCEKRFFLFTETLPPTGNTTAQ